MDNLVTVSPRSHFILHLLLTKMTIYKKHKKSMYYALFMMMNTRSIYYSSRLYESARIKVSQNMKNNNPMHNPNTRKKLCGRKRPEQSSVAKKRNKKYWKDKARPIREFKCPVCNTPIITRIPTQKTCSKSCATKLQWLKVDSVSKLNLQSSD